MPQNFNSNSKGAFNFSTHFTACMSQKTIGTTRSSITNHSILASQRCDATPPSNPSNLPVGTPPLLLSIFTICSVQGANQFKEFSKKTSVQFDMADKETLLCEFSGCFRECEKGNLVHDQPNYLQRLEFTPCTPLFPILDHWKWASDCSSTPVQASCSRHRNVASHGTHL